MSIKKQFLKSKPECKVTFKFEKTADIAAETVKVVGNFNNWDKDTEPMKALKSGDFTQTINLSSGSDIQFRYLVNDTLWVNDESADSFVDAGLGDAEKNGVIQL
ncbi:isoamylase early set domain-containing protein [Labilibacter marinus]|uniref:isoamylase early set domain-containing protein n=1 Tax=Labilibacter marinus TaxID=1477105 RepID=UPI00082BDF3F|nr:isoamylase early set domain-containing protein [Labilibacter marinus]